MGIINGYEDIQMVISNLVEDDIRSVFAGRKFAVIKIDQHVIDNNPRVRMGMGFDLNDILGIYLDAYTLLIDDEDETHSRTYLFVKVRLPLRFTPVDGVSILYPSVEELIPMLLGKRLVFSTGFVEDYCVVENVINRKLQEYVFALRNEDEYYLYDDFFRIQVFLQKISSAGTTVGPALMEPSDIREYDINERILSKLEEESNSFYHDAITIRYYVF